MSSNGTSDVASQLRADHALGPPAAGSRRHRRAKAAGLHVRISMVALAGINDHEIEPMRR